jgi:hypothetical protein
MMMSSTSSVGIPERLSASPIEALASSKTLTSMSEPRRAVPMAVRAAETMTASPMTFSPDLLVPHGVSGRERS